MLLERVLGWIDRHRRWVAVALATDLAVIAVVIVAGSTSAGNATASLLPPAPPLPPNDLLASVGNLAAVLHLSNVPQLPLQTSNGPTLAPVPGSRCGAGSHPLPGEQGRVSAAAMSTAQAVRGWNCNLTKVSHFPVPGGFRVWRYVDTAGHVCAFYDAAPADAGADYTRLLLGVPGPGTVVLNMADPARPAETDLLTALPMRAPHESLNLNAKRGLLVAEEGNAGTQPGLMATYDVSRDCLHPTLDSTFLAAPFGHESGFAPDGRTFYIAGGAGIAAVDVSDPTDPHTLWEGDVDAHGLSLSDDGETLYDSDPFNGQLIVLNVSQIQDRDPNPVVTEISRTTWPEVSIPQNTDPMTIGDHHYLFEFDEFAFRFVPPTDDNMPGAARIINIDDPAHPRVVSNIRLAVNMPTSHAAVSSDPSPLPSNTVTYSAHYCAIPREVDPEIAACSFTNSGLRVFNIQNPLRPRQVAYFVSPPSAGTLDGVLKGDFAMSQPAFDPARRQIYYTDADSGFYALQLSPSAWPDATRVPATKAHRRNPRRPTRHAYHRRTRRAADTVPPPAP